MHMAGCHNSRRAARLRTYRELEKTETSALPVAADDRTTTLHPNLALLQLPLLRAGSTQEAWAVSHSPSQFVDDGHVNTCKTCPEKDSQASEIRK